MNHENAGSQLSSRDASFPDRFRNLLQYYIACAKEDKDQSVTPSVNDAGTRFIPWPCPSDPWRLNDGEPAVVLSADQVSFAHELRKMGSGGSLLYGYPLYIEASRTLIPLFIWPIEYELHGRELKLRCTPEWPQVNPGYLSTLSLTKEEEREVLDSLDLLDTTDDPSDGLIPDILKRVGEMGLLQNVREPIDPQNIVRWRPPDRHQGGGLYNRAALFAMSRPSYTASLIRDLEEMVESDPTEWMATALGTLLGVREDASDEEQDFVEVVELNEEQRRAVRKAISSPLTAVTGPPGTGKSQIVVSMIADAYMRGRRVLFSSKNNKAVDVVETRVDDLSANPMMVRTGSGSSGRNFRHELAQSLVSMLAFQPSQDDRRNYRSLRTKYDALRRQEGDLWEELRTIRLANSRLLSLHQVQTSFEKDYAPHEWKELLGVKGPPDSEKLTAALKLADKHIADSDIPLNYFSHLGSVSDQLTKALQLADKHVASWDIPSNHFLHLRSASGRLAEGLQLAERHVGGSDTLSGRFSLWRSASKDRKHIESISEAAVTECPAINPCPTDRQSFQVWRNWLLEALSITRKLSVIDRHRKRIQSVATDAVSDCPGLDPCPSDQQSFHTWYAWLLEALSVTKQMGVIDRDRKRIESVATEAVAECPVLERPAENQSFRAWRTWLSRALSIVDPLNAIAGYRRGLAELGESRSRDEVARQLRRVRSDLADSGAKLVAIYARLAPDRLTPSDRRAIGSFRALQDRLGRDRLDSRPYPQIRRDMARLFPDVSRHIPAWCVTNLSARNSFPLEPNLFDLLIIDEASQCDIASALPLLYRSRRAVIIGDPQQLRHITDIERRRDHQLQSTHELAADDPHDHIFAYSQNSLFDLTISRGAIEEVIQLQDHYRSHSHIVGFSNRHWYQNSLRIWTDYGRLKAPPDGKYGIRWTNVSGIAQRSRAGSVFILSEVEAIVGRVIDLLLNQGFDGTVGVVTPFRPQANMIWERISRRVPPDLLSRAEFIVDTAHGFQGDERDIILFSPCVSRDLPSGASYFLKTNENLFNVTVTRARSLLHVVGSREACSESGIPHIQRFASYCTEIERSASSPYETTLASDERVGPWERPLYDALVAKGLNPSPQHPVNQYRLDLAIISGETRIDVEADGESTHLDSRIDTERDSRLESLGWRVVRFWNHQIKDDIDYCVRTVLNLVDRQP